ncbi:MAG: hypothetical protein Q4B27_01710 [Candidatus Saccharibacteria bacterium]|nr:hypothetical protein [Candidatus Saccharibacteria bacterium]
MVIFKQSIYAVNVPLPEPTVEDCKWGENCTAGVIVEHDRQTWIRLTQSNDESSRSIIQEIDPSSKEAAQLQMKLEKFLTVQEERQAQNECDRCNQMQIDDEQPRAIDDLEISLW